MFALNAIYRPSDPQTHTSLLTKPTLLCVYVAIRAERRLFKAADDELQSKVATSAGVCEAAVFPLSGVAAVKIR